MSDEYEQPEPMAAEEPRGPMPVTGENNTTPWTALLHEVRRSAYRALWIDSRITDEVADERQLRHETELSEQLARASEVRKWLDQSRRERQHLARVSKMAIDSGLAERYVYSIEVEAKLIARVLERALGVVELTTDQKRLVAHELRAALADVSGELHERHLAIGS